MTGRLFTFVFTAAALVGWPFIGAEMANGVAGIMGWTSAQSKDAFFVMVSLFVMYPAICAGTFFGLRWVFTGKWGKE